MNQLRYFPIEHLSFPPELWLRWLKSQLPVRMMNQTEHHLILLMGLLVLLVAQLWLGQCFLQECLLW